MSNRLSFTFAVAAAVSSVVLFGIPALAQNITPLTPPNPQPAQVFESEITVTATGEETEVEAVPAPTTVISKEQIQNSQNVMVEDLLRRVLGLTVLRAGDEGKQSSVFTRGTNSTQTLVMFDGVRLNSPYFGGYDWSMMTTAGLDRIEVARGPYSALWGADAIGGVINLIPQRSRDDTVATMVGEWGEYGWQRYEGDLVLGGERFGMYLSGLWREGDGGLENSAYSNQQLLLDLGWDWGVNGSRVAVVAQDIEAETEIPYLTPGSPTPNRRQSSQQRLIAIPLRWAVGPGWNLELVGATVEGEFSFEDPDDPWGLTENETSTERVEVRLSSIHRAAAHTFTWGGEWRSDEVSQTSNIGTNLDKATTEVTSGFVQDVWRASDKLNLILGVRWDDTEQWGDEVSPRINLGWQMSRTLKMRIGYGHGFRPPSLGELYFPGSGNPELQPETSSSYELDFVYRPQSGKTRWQLNLFSTDLDNLIEFDFISYTNQNVGTASIRGAELALDWVLSEVASQQLQVTYLDATDDNGLTLLRRPEWSGAYSLSGLLWYKVRGDISVIWVGSREDVDPVTYERVTLGNHFTLDLAIAWEVFEGGEVTARALNLLDEEYQEVAGYPALGRRFMAGLRVRL